MPKKSQALIKAINSMNLIAKKEEVFVWPADRLENRNHLGTPVSCTSDLGAAYKQGLFDAMEILLHSFDCYQGFRYTGGVQSEHVREYYNEVRNRK